MDERKTFTLAFTVGIIVIFVLLWYGSRIREGNDNNIQDAIQSVNQSIDNSRSKVGELKNQNRETTDTINRVTETVGASREQIRDSQRYASEISKSIDELRDETERTLSMARQHQEFIKSLGKTGSKSTEGEQAPQKGK